MNYAETIKTHLHRLEYELNIDLSDEITWLNNLQVGQNGPTKLYTATFFGLKPNNLEEKFKQTRRFSNKEKALEWLREITLKDMPKLHQELLGDTDSASDMYCHLALSIDKDGHFEYVTSHVFSYLLANGEEKQFENENEIFKNM